jgi:hypothetical protein
MLFVLIEQKCKHQLLDSNVQNILSNPEERGALAVACKQYNCTENVIGTIKLAHHFSILLIEQENCINRPPIFLLPSRTNKVYVVSNQNNHTLNI